MVFEIKGLPLEKVYLEPLSCRTSNDILVHIENNNIIGLNDI